MRRSLRPSRAPAAVEDFEEIAPERESEREIELAHALLHPSRYPREHEERPENADDDRVPAGVPRRRTTKTAQIVLASVLAVLSLTGTVAVASRVTREIERAPVVQAPAPALPPAAATATAPEPAPIAESPPPALDPPLLDPSLDDAPMPVVDRAAARKERNEAQAALEMRDLPRARDAAARAVHLDPEHADGWLLLGAAYLDLREEWAARRAFAACAKHAKRGPRGECAALIRPPNAAVLSRAH
ncbi:MAG: hypothetical protein KF819_23310 [Labilithrix sp.]|nr:hypothetical protein [Labilithrix sp.]